MEEQKTQIKNGSKIIRRKKEVKRKWKKKKIG